jgi:hypothetical protein
MPFNENHVDEQWCGIHAHFSSPVEPEPEPEPETEAALNVAPYKKAITVTGDTKTYKATLKALGGRWNPTLVAWIFPGSKQEVVVAALRSDGITVAVTGTAPVERRGGREMNTLDPSLCRCRIWNNGVGGQCSRTVVRDGLCSQHASKISNPPIGWSCGFYDEPRPQFWGKTYDDKVALCPGDRNEGRKIPWKEN